MQYWRPVPQALIADLLLRRWSKDDPAPDAVGFMVVLDRMMSGAPWSARKLATYTGWSRWRASQVQSQAQAFRDEWNAMTGQPTVTNTWQPPMVNNVVRLQPPTSQKPTTDQPETGHHARAVYKNTKKQNKTRTLSSTNVDSVWSQMEDIRLESNPSGKRAKLGGRRNELRLRVREHGDEVVVNAWRWFWNSNDRRAKYLRDEGYGVKTFLRPGNLRDYVDRANEWKPGEGVSGEGWYTDDDFDEHGNLMTNGGE
tara:strand:- start:6917 stop:7681 length:765 start_codon:yes stop_codon:yes gene_type:complete